MRVLQVGQLPKEMGGHYTTGVARVVGELSRYKFGVHEVYLYATNISNEKAQLLHSEYCTYLGYVKRPFCIIAHIILHPIETLYSFKTYRKTDKATSFLHMEFIRDNYARIIEEVKPDVIHYHGTALSAMFFANMNRKIPILYSPHALVWADKDSNEDIRSVAIRTAQLTMSFADHYTALNESVLKRMRLLNIDEERITIVPNGVDSKKFYFSESARKEVREALRVKEGTIVFISVGLVIDRKGQFAFLKFLQSLGIDYQYWIIGRGPDEEPIKKFVEENGIWDKVKLLGYIEDKDIYKYHSAADYYAHVSFYEAQALSEIEAYSCGLPIIVNKDIADTVIGYPCLNRQLYYVLNFVQPDIAEIKAWLYLERSRRTSRNQYDWQIVAEMYSECYEKIMKKLSVSSI